MEILLNTFGDLIKKIDFIYTEVNSNYLYKDFIKNDYNHLYQFNKKIENILLISN